jgi:hypothetical protein
MGDIYIFSHKYCHVMLLSLPHFWRRLGDGLVQCFTKMSAFSRGNGFSECTYAI